MPEWEQYQEVLYGLYMTENKDINKTIEHMRSVYSFQATLAQYRLQFKKWKWNKNMTKSDWVYVSQQMKQRGQKKSVVYHRGLVILPAKVSKNISRYTHPNDAFRPGTSLPSQDYMSVCTPHPFDLDSEPHYTCASVDMMIFNHVSVPGTPNSRSQQVVSTRDSQSQKAHSTILSDSKTWQNVFVMLGKVDLNGLPYYQLRDMLNSEDVKQEFREIVTWNDSRQGNLIHFWPESTPTTSDEFVLLSPTSSCELDVDDTWSMLYQRPYPQPKAFGFSLLHNTLFSVDDLIIKNEVTLNLNSFLRQMPFEDEKEMLVLEKVLLGPPTVEAARRFVEVGIYIISNNMGGTWQRGEFIETMLQSISWSILRRTLSLDLSSMQSFTESVFLHAIKTNRLLVVEDLLQRESIRATVSNGSALKSSVQTSNYNLVSLILAAGANPNVLSELTHQLPLTEARTVEISQLLLSSGADINSLSPVFYYKKHYIQESAIVAATIQRNVELVRHLIKSGADVNLQAKGTTRGGLCFTAAMVAVELGMIDILQLLLQAKARSNEMSNTYLEVGEGPIREMTLIQKAVTMGDTEIVQLLVRYGGDVNAPASRVQGTTALRPAVSQADIKMTKLLIENGGDVNACDKTNAQYPCSLLTTAVEMNNFDLVKVLLDAGAQLNVPSFGLYGCTALESAMSSQCTSKITDLLAARGAQRSTQFNAQFNDDYRQVQLRRAVIAGDLAKVQSILQRDFKIDSAPFYRHQPHLLGDVKHKPGNSKRTISTQLDTQGSILQYAIAKGTAIFNTLFDVINNYKENIDFHPLLLEAIRVENIEVLGTLLKAGANINSTRCHAGRLIGTPLMFAVYLCDMDTVRFLCDRRADINSAVEACVLDFHGYEVFHDFASTALQISIWMAPRRGQKYCFDIFHFLTGRGAIVNGPVAEDRGLSELAMAVRRGSLDIVEELLNSGADVNSLPAERGGETALQAASGWGFKSLDMVQLLLQWEADVNAACAKTNGMTALGAAAGRGNFQVARILLQAGADVNALSTRSSYAREGSTPLMLAAVDGRLDMVHLLLKAGADLHLPESERYVSAASEARSSGHIAIVTVLENWKVDEKLECSLSTAFSLSQRNSRMVELD